MNPLINILIRTNGKREESFKQCLQSVIDQTYKNVRVIVSYDCEVKPDYVQSMVQISLTEECLTAMLIDIIKVKKQPSLYGYNIYCNDLKSKVTAGYMLYLDDDDILQDNRALERIVPHLSEDKITICQMIRGLRVKPRYGEIESGKIGMPCFLLHAKHKDIAMFDDSGNADYRFIATVCSKLPHNFVPIVMVRSDRRSYGA